jgi:hypothetical protein
VEAEKLTLKMKYKKEVQLCLGCASIHNEDGLKVGKRANHFYYSGRIIRTLKYCALERKEEVSRVEAFTSIGAGFWVKGQRQNGSFYHNDEPQLHLKATMGKLRKHAITTGVGHIRDMTDGTIQNIVAAKSYLPRARLIQLRDQAQNSRLETSQGSKIIKRKPTRMNQSLIQIGNNTSTSR